MSTFQNNLHQTIDWVRQAFPPDALVHVGAGRGIGDMHQWREWGVSRALLIDPLVKPDDGFEHLLREHAGWDWIPSALAAEDDEADFYVASNPNESGLLDIERLLPLWPNLRTMEWSRVVTQRLDSLLMALNESLSPDWLIVDCLPALPVLQGTGKFLDGVQVVWVRVVLDETLINVREAGLAGLTEFLLPKSYRCVFQSSGTRVGEAIFVKDWLRLFKTEYLLNKAFPDPAMISQQEQIAPERDWLERENLRLAAEVEKLSADNQRLQTMSDGLTSEKFELEHTCERLTRKRAELIVTRDALARKKTELLGICEQRAREIERLSSDYLRLRQAFDERTHELSLFEQEKSELLQQLQILRSERSILLDEREHWLREKSELADHQWQLKAHAGLQSEPKDIAEQREALADSLESARTSLMSEREEQLSAQAVNNEESTPFTDRVRELEKTLTLYQSQLDNLTQENRALADQVSEQDRHNAELRIECDRLTMKAKDGSAPNQTLMSTSHRKVGGLPHGSADLLAEQQRLLDEAERGKAALATQRLNLALEMSSLAARLADREAILQEKEQRLECLESELSEYNRRLYQMNQEMLKAEAQINLIKDLVLRDPNA